MKRYKIQEALIGLLLKPSAFLIKYNAAKEELEYQQFMAWAKRYEQRLANNENPK